LNPKKLNPKESSPSPHYKIQIIDARVCGAPRKKTNITKYHKNMSLKIKIARMRSDNTKERRSDDKNPSTTWILVHE
jgi:hypothetical protein